jgi:hypothetical protein
MKYNLLCRIGCHGFGGIRLSGESGENASRHYGPSGQFTTAQQPKSEVALTATKTHQIPAPASSPDLYPSDFFLFGMLKKRMSGTYSSPDELISARSELIASLPKDQLITVYKNWMKRLTWVIKHRREYYLK